MLKGCDFTLLAVAATDQAPHRVQHIEVAAHHYVFISDRARVLDEIRTFLATK